MNQGEKDERDDIELDLANDERGGNEEADEDETHPAPSEAKKKHSGLSFDHYLGGGAIGFSLALWLIVAADWLFEKWGVEMSVPILIAVSFFPSLVGAALGAFLFTRRSRRNYLVDGFKIGVFSLVITFLYTMLFQVAVGGVYIIIGFLVGGSLGGYIAKSI